MSNLFILSWFVVILRLKNCINAQSLGLKPIFNDLFLGKCVGCAKVHIISVGGIVSYLLCGLAINLDLCHVTFTKSWTSIAFKVCAKATFLRQLTNGLFLLILCKDICPGQEKKCAFFLDHNHRPSKFLLRNTRINLLYICVVNLFLLCDNLFKVIVYGKHHHALYKPHRPSWIS